MEERLSPRRERGITRGALHLMGLAFMALGMMGRTLLQNPLLAAGTDLEQVLSQSPDAMNMATASIVLQAIEAMAIPIFAVLTLEGFEKTASVKKYLLRLLALAVASEVPYHLARSGQLWEPAPRNPVFGLVIAVVMLYLMRTYSGTDFKGLAVKILALIAGCLWCYLLQVDSGLALVLIVYVLWIFRGRHTLAYLAGAAMALMLTVSQPLYLFAPFGFLLTHFYNGTQKEGSRLLHYALYPAGLVLIAAAAKLL